MPQISNDNPFNTGYGLIIDTPYLVREKLSVKPHRLDRWHMVVEGDRIEMLSYKYYSQYTVDAQNWWWLLADANNISNPFALSNYVGRYFLIPDFFRAQLLVNELSNDLGTKKFGDFIRSYEQEADYSINEIYPLAFGSLGGNILPDYGTPNVPTTPVDPTGNCTPKRVHLFFEMQNGGGYKIAHLDADGHIEYYEADPNDYCNSLIVELPSSLIPPTDIQLDTITPILANDENSFSLQGDEILVNDEI
jgi:hypothetical protein